MNDQIFISGTVYFCFPESKNVKLISNHTKIIIQSFIGNSMLGTSVKIYFEDEFLWGDLKKVKLELLSLEPIKDDLNRGVPMRLLFATSMPMGIFLPDADRDPAVRDVPR